MAAPIAKIKVMTVTTARFSPRAAISDAAPSVAVVALPLSIQAFLLSLLSGLAVARWHALFQARGPPLPR